MSYTDAQLDRIDRLIAEKVMEWTVIQAEGFQYDEIGGTTITWPEFRDSAGKPIMFVTHPGLAAVPLWPQAWHPTRDHGQAMMVLEKADIAVAPTSLMDGSWDKPAYLAAWRLGAEDGIGCMAYYHDGQRDKYQATADTPQQAICLAALKKVGVEVPE